jgi:hypothetical protein
VRRSHFFNATKSHRSPQRGVRSRQTGRQSNSSYLQFTHKAFDSLKQLEHRIPILLVSSSTVAQAADPSETRRRRTRSSRRCSGAPTRRHFVIFDAFDSKGLATDVGFRVENDVVSVSTKFTDLGSLTETSWSAMRRTNVPC